MQEDVRLHPWRALRCLLTVVRDPERTDAGASMVQALEGRSRERLRKRILAHPTGARIVSEGRRLEHVLGDRAGLEALPEGSLGRRYAAWTRDEGLSADGLIRASGGANGALDWERRLLDCRSACAHDLWHVVTGYGRDLLGELALLHFTLVQTGNTGLLLPCWLGLLSSRYGRKGRRLVFQARRRARRASWLPAADWEGLLDQPLPDVRARLQVGPPPCYTPVWSERSPTPAPFRAARRPVPPSRTDGGSAASPSPGGRPG